MILQHEPVTALIERTAQTSDGGIQLAAQTNRLAVIDMLQQTQLLIG